MPSKPTLMTFHPYWSKTRGVGRGGANTVVYNGIKRMLKNRNKSADCFEYLSWMNHSGISVYNIVDSYLIFDIII